MYTEIRFAPRTRNILLFFSSTIMYFGRHGSGKATIGAWIDIRRPLKLVLRFDTSRSGTNFLSLVEPIQHIYALSFHILKDICRLDSPKKRRLYYLSWSFLPLGPMDSTKILSVEFFSLLWNPVYEHLCSYDGTSWECNFQTVVPCFKV